MFPVVVGGIRSFNPSRSSFRILASIEVAIEAGEVATGNFQPQAMSGEKDVASGPDVDSELVNISWLHEFRFFLRGAIPRAQDSVSQILRVPVRSDINQFGREVRVHSG